MDMAMVLDALANYGMTFVLMAYFLIKDWKFNAQITEVLGEIRETLVILKEHI